MTPQFIAWTYVPGANLAATIRADGALRADELDALGAALADSLGRLHSAGIVHRDVKPSNIQVGPDGPVLLDLGVSKAADGTSLTQPLASVGTSSWMSPEQWQGTSSGPDGDVWAWGAVIAYCAGGQHPFGHGTGEAIGYRVVHEAPDVPRLREPLAGLVTRALDKDPSVRPNCDEILRALGVGSEGIDVFVGSRWSRLGRLAVGRHNNTDQPTVRIRTDQPTVAALPPTRLERSPAQNDRSRRHLFLALVAVSAVLLLGLLAVAIVGREDGTASGARWESLFPTATPSASSPQGDLGVIPQTRPVADASPAASSSNGKAKGAGKGKGLGKAKHTAKPGKG